MADEAKVLLVDDRDDSLFAVASALALLGCPLERAASGERGGGRGRGEGGFVHIEWDYVMFVILDWDVDCVSSFLSNLMCGPSMWGG